MKHEIISTIRKQLLEHSDVKTKESGSYFFKEKVMLYGVKTAVVITIAKSHEQVILHLDKKDVFALCDELWKSGNMEESFIACHYAYRMHKRFEPIDFTVFEKWVYTYVSNWASCDTLCNHTIGTFIEMYPEYIRGLKKWALSDNRWVKRASAVTLILPARHGKFLHDMFEIADRLLLDSDDLVQKGYGWMLKAASQAHEKEVFAYVMRNKVKMPRTALRYAIEKMPQDLKARAMAK